MSFPLNGRTIHNTVELKFISTLNKEIITLLKYIRQLNFWLTYISFSPKLFIYFCICPALVLILTDSTFISYWLKYHHQPYISYVCISKDA